MKFILLYGAPATGKLTVAKELQKLTNFKLLHNHLVVDLIEAIDTNRTPEFFALQERILTDVINFAIAKDVSLVNTFVYGHGVDTAFMDFIKKTVETAGGKVYFIQLVCKREILMRRVTEDSRQSYGKITNPERLASILEQYDLTTPYSETTLIIDNSDKSSNEVAQEIVTLITEAV